MPDTSHKPKPKSRPVPLAGVVLLVLALASALVATTACSSHDGSHDEAQTQTGAQPSRLASMAFDAPDADTLRILKSIYVQMDDIRVRLSPLGTPVSEWPVDAQGYIRQVEETGAWPGEESRWPTDGGLDDPRVLVEICRECEEYVNERTPEHWETSDLQHPYAEDNLEQVPLAEDIGVIVNMHTWSGGSFCTSVLWRDGEPVGFGVLEEMEKLVAQARPRSLISIGNDIWTALMMGKGQLEGALADDAVLGGRRFDVSETSQGRIRVCISESKDDERLGYPLRTEEGMLSLMESLGDALPAGTEFVVSSTGGSRDVVGFCVSTCDCSEQPVVELSLERHGSREEAEDALGMPVAVPAELNGREPYAWDIAMTRDRGYHDLGAVARPVLIVRYGSPSDVEGVLVMGDFLLSDVRYELFADDDWGDFHYVDELSGDTKEIGTSNLSVNECSETLRVDWYADSDTRRTFDYNLEVRKPKDMDSEAMVNDFAHKIYVETHLGNLPE